MQCTQAFWEATFAAMLAAGQVLRCMQCLNCILKKAISLHDTYFVVVKYDFELLTPYMT